VIVGGYGVVAHDGIFSDPRREGLPRSLVATKIVRVSAVDRRHAPLVAATVLGGALFAWIVLAARMRGMDAGPGTDLGSLGWFVGIWLTMTAAMMLPSTVPTVIVFARVSRDRPRSGELVPAWVFVAGYLAAWTIYGLAAYAVYRGVRALDPSFLAWDRAGPWIAGCALAAAGLYQLTPLKSACLRRCRSPLHFILRRRRPGYSGALRLGFEHGSFCIGCCAGLMLALFAVGVMSLFWMALAALLILAEKVLPAGERIAVGLAVALAALGLWVATAPASVPGLTQPHRMQMEMH
jgi:predicted metal-binding membrane protein